MSKIEKLLLDIWLTFLQKANSGLNLNLLSYRYPTNLTLSDACPTGLGGY